MLGSRSSLIRWSCALLVFEPHLPLVPSDPILNTAGTKVIDCIMGFATAAIAAIAIYIVAHDYYGVIDSVIARDALAGASVLGLGFAANLFRRFAKK